MAEPVKVVMVSGGVDSTLCWHKTGGIPVFFDLNQPYVEKEKQAVARLFGDALVSVKIDNEVAGTAMNPFIPARNLFFASYAAMRFNADEIYMAGLKDDNVVDKSPEAFEEMSKILTWFSKKPVKVLSPFWQRTKGQIIADFLDGGGDPQVLLDTVSCYDGEGLSHCGKCPACFRRWVALESNGVKAGPIDRGIAIRYLAKIHDYDIDRRNRTFIALRPLFASIQAYDIDGTLTKETFGYGAAYKARTPRSDMIERVNRAYDDGHLVVLYTARLHSDRAVTEDWLRDNGVRYHSLIMGKLPFDLLVDDKVERV